MKNTRRTTKSRNNAPQSTSKFKGKRFWIISGIAGSVALLLLGAIVGIHRSSFFTGTSSDGAKKQEDAYSSLFETAPTIKRIEKSAGKYVVYWEMKTDTQITGFNLYYGTQKNKPTGKVAVKDIDHYNLNEKLQEHQIYFINVTAVDENGQESQPSKTALVIR